MVFVLLITFLVCGENEELSEPPSVPQKQKKQLQPKLRSQPFGVYLPEMRKVPNASDPLHNR